MINISVGSWRDGITSRLSVGDDSTDIFTPVTCCLRSRRTHLQKAEQLLRPNFLEFLNKWSLTIRRISPDIYLGPEASLKPKGEDRPSLFMHRNGPRLRSDQFWSDPINHSYLIG